MSYGCRKKENYLRSSMHSLRIQDWALCIINQLQHQRKEKGVPVNVQDPIQFI